MRVLILDHLHLPSLVGKVANGVQKFTKNQVSLLSDIAECFYVTGSGSDVQFENQIVLETPNGRIQSSAEYEHRSTLLRRELSSIVSALRPDVVLDSSGRRLITPSENCGAVVVFEHYHTPSRRFLASDYDSFHQQAYWVGVSRWQREQFGNLFDDTICIHFVDECPSEVKPAKEYGIFVGSWDGGKYPHIALRYYLGSGLGVPVKCFIRFGGKSIPPRELDFLSNSPLFEFHFDAPRSDIFQSMAEAAFGLGMGNESTGIVSLEYASFGVPYIVPGNKKVAELEHLPDWAVHICDKSSDVPMEEQYRRNVNSAMQWSLSDRKRLSDSVISKFNRKHFIDEHMRIILGAQEKTRKNKV